MTNLIVSLVMFVALQSGHETFVSRCAGCHGTDGNGGELGPAITTRVPLRSDQDLMAVIRDGDRKSTRLNSSHEWISYAVFCLKKKTARLILTFDILNFQVCLHIRKYVHRGCNRVEACCRDERADLEKEVVSQYLP